MVFGALQLIIVLLVLLPALVPLPAQFVGMQFVRELKLLLLALLIVAGAVRLALVLLQIFGIAQRSLLALALVVFGAIMPVLLRSAPLVLPARSGIVIPRLPALQMPAIGVGLIVLQVLALCVIHQA